MELTVCSYSPKRLLCFFCFLCVCVCVCVCKQADKPWLQQKPAPWENPNNNHDNFKCGRRIIEERPGETGPMTKDAKAAMREELRGQMEAGSSGRWFYISPRPTVKYKNK